MYVLVDVWTAYVLVRPVNRTLAPWPALGNLGGASGIADMNNRRSRGNRSLETHTNTRTHTHTNTHTNTHTVQRVS